MGTGRGAEGEEGGGDAKEQAGGSEGRQGTQARQATGASKKAVREHLCCEAVYKQGWSKNEKRETRIAAPLT